MSSKRTGYRVQSHSYKVINGQSIGTSAVIERRYQTLDDARDGLQMFVAVARALDATIIDQSESYVRTQRRSEYSEAVLLAA